MSNQNTNQYEPVSKTVVIGNLGAEALDFSSKETGKPFVVATLYTQKRYRPEGSQEWVSLPSVKHQIISFSSMAMADLKAYKVGARIKVTGELIYRAFDVVLDNGEVVTKYETAIKAYQIETASLPKKREQNDMPQLSETFNTAPAMIAA